MTEPLVLGIDLGTSRFKAALFEPSGRLAGLGRADVPKEESQGICELQLLRFKETLSGCVQTALRQAGAQPGAVKAVGYSSQANSFLLLDREAQPLTPLILWPDLRGAEMMPQVRQLTQRPDFLDRTGLGLETPEFCIAKLLWYQRHQTNLWERVRKISTISSFLVWELTGQPTSDEGTAALLAIWDLPGHKWWDEALETIGLAHSQFSTPLPPGSLAGKVHERGTGWLGLPVGIPVAAGSLDHHIAAIGAGISGPQRCSLSLGTVTAILRYSPQYKPLPNCCMGPGTHGCGFYQLAFDGNGTGALDWYRRCHAREIDFATLTDRAGAVAPGSDGLWARPSAQQYGGLEGFIGAAREQGQYARALMESTAASVRSLLEHLCPDEAPEGMIATGGGAANDLWLQIVANMTGVEIQRSACEEPGCKGAAMLAAVAAGWYADLQEATEDWSALAAAFVPDPAVHSFYRQWWEEYGKIVA